MTKGENGSKRNSGSAVETRVAGRPPASDAGSSATVTVVVTEVSPFHCLYQDALDFHTQSRLMLKQSESASARLARASLLLYVASAEALIHQAATELARPELAAWIADPLRPVPDIESWKLLPAIVGAGAPPPLDLAITPWPQMAELLALRSAWAYPGPPAARRAYYLASKTGASFDPLQPHQAPRSFGITPEMLVYPRTGLPRDPYALRPHHLDTTRGVIDAAIEALDRKLDGALTRDNRHRREPIDIFQAPPR